MPLILTRKQSLVLGLGLLGLFFVVSGTIIYQRNKPRISTQPNSLSKESVEGVSPIEPQLTPAPSGTPGSGLGFVLNEFHRSLVRDGKTVWEIFGKKGRYVALANQAQIDEPNLTVTRDNGDKINLTAGRAELALSGTELSTAHLYDNVVVTYRGDTTVKTSQAIYDQKNARVEIPVPVELDSPMFSLQGNRLVALIDSQEITISNGVKSTIKPRTR